MYCVGYVNFPTTAEGAAEREKAGPVSVDEEAEAISAALARVQACHRGQGFVVLGHSIGAWLVMQHLKLASEELLVELRHVVLAMPYLEYVPGSRQTLLLALASASTVVRMLALTVTAAPRVLKGLAARVMSSSGPGSYAYDATMATFLEQPHHWSMVVGLLRTECPRLDPRKEGCGFAEFAELLRRKGRPSISAFFTKADLWSPMAHHEAMKGHLSSRDQLVDLASTAWKAGRPPKHEFVLSAPHLEEMAGLVAASIELLGKPVTFLDECVGEKAGAGEIPQVDKALGGNVGRQSRVMASTLSLPTQFEDVFLNVDAKSASQSTLRRCRSFSGYAPFELSEVNFEFGLKPRVDPEGTAEDPWPDTDDEDTVAWVQAQSADTVAPPFEDIASTGSLGLSPPTPSATTGKGYASVNLVSASAAQAFQNAWRSRTLAPPAGGSLQVDIARVQGLQMNMEKWFGGHMHPELKPIASPQVLAKEQQERTMPQAAVRSAPEQVMKAQRAGTMVLKKVRAMMPAVDMQPSVPSVRPRRGRRCARTSARPQNPSQGRRDSQRDP
ncbi:pgkA [Symbiodinium natans]|uniref:PgkA protein n=1 Tax=Symbiodinium natans TaxID=878477 RepID=A0A812RIZ8_9DINO|nr:pgkA [Symbiodinium natans]